MAEKNNNSSQVGTRRFDKELNQDINDFHLPDSSWTYARNAINNSRTGDLGKLGNEPSTKFCAKVEYAVKGPIDPIIIGTIHLEVGLWGIMSTDGVTSEIGVFEEDICKYTTIVNDPCLNFNPAHLIKGVSRPTSKCNYTMYWDDGLNPSRAISIITNPLSDNAYNNPLTPIPWITIPVQTGTCIDYQNTPKLDCDKIRLARLIDTPCVKVSNGFGSGTLLNGSYMVAIAYTIDDLKISDWYISNVQPLFNHNNVSCSLDVELLNLDTRFDYVHVAIISTTNQQTQAKFAGTYSTKQQLISFDLIDNTWPNIPIEQIPIMTPIADKSDAMYTVNDYLLRVGPTSKFDFNYQPLANQIVTKWQSVEYPADYYRKGGNRVGYLRDEVYSFFIRWVYDTGDKSSAYHIPGRPAGKYWFNRFTGVVEDDRAITGGDDASPETEVNILPENWMVYNTAGITTSPMTVPLGDGGVVIAEGLMGYWESSEVYPDNKPEIWNSVNNPLGNGFITNTSPYSAFDTAPFDITSLDLCGKQIRHHKIPDLDLGAALTSSSIGNIGPLEYLGPTNNIRIIGVAFDNIKPPLLNDGVTPVPGIVGYEILRGTRNGNRTILAKGLISNMRKYDLPKGLKQTPVKGAFANYPYNELANSNNPDKFLSKNKVTESTCDTNGGFWTMPGGNYVGLDNTYYELFTFHSPDTNFINPFLSAKEIKVHGEFNGDVIGKFELSEKHPKHKLITDWSFLLGAIAGIALAGLEINGQRRVNYKQPTTPGYSSIDPFTLGVSPNPLTYIPAMVALTSIKLGQYGAEIAKGGGADIGLNVLSGLAGNNLVDLLNLYQTSFSTAFPDLIQSTSDVEIDDGAYSNIPFPLRLLQISAIFFNYFNRGADSALNLIRATLTYRDFALRYHSHCFYNRYVPKFNAGDNRRVILDSKYMGPQIMDFDSRTRINNLYRSSAVVVKTATTSASTPNTTYTYNDLPVPVVEDVTRIPATAVDALWEVEFPGKNNEYVLKDPTKQDFGAYNTYNTIKNVNNLDTVVPGSGKFIYNNINHSGIQIASSNYVSLKQRLRNQYGQLNNIKMVLAESCKFSIKDCKKQELSNQVLCKTSTVFGGDVYIGRYTEKNTFFFFYDWMYGQPDGTEFNYAQYVMIPYPRYWANFNQFQTSDFTNSSDSFFTDLATDLITGGSADDNSLITPKDYYNLNGIRCSFLGINLFSKITLDVRYAWFYLFYSGVKDFYVESEINIDLRDWGETVPEYHYDPNRYTDTKTLFDTQYIKATNYYKYDFSLSYSKLWFDYISWGTMQRNNYDPFLTEFCYVYRPKRLIYSLQSNLENIKDNWFTFLSNNYYDFNNTVSCIKPINKTGAFIFFDAQSPQQFFGVDQLESVGGTKFTIGDGGLFKQPLQSITNADQPYEYASCQDRLSVINTPTGIYWVSQNQGKIFTYGDGVKELSMNDIKWWLASYLPFQMLNAFPGFTVTDNPVVGIGTQSIFDNLNGLIYFTKKDYKLKDNLPSSIKISYKQDDVFTVTQGGASKDFQLTNGKGELTTDAKLYFEDASWTISYDPKVNSWISFHDWHPSLLMPGRNTFMSVVGNTIWTHNERFDSYCNFYGKDYPFEVEYMVNNIQSVSTLRSIEYQLECYKYAPNGYDRFHELDFNFDEAVIYNTEQVSGVLKLNVDPKNDPAKILTYPAINTLIPNIDILFSKEENKYRFNQFWDITDDRGEYFNPNIPGFAQRVIWNRAANGYIRSLNNINLNYVKPDFQRKKFRHYTNQVLLKKKVSGDKKMLIIITNNKELYSPR